MSDIDRPEKDNALSRKQRILRKQREADLVSALAHDPTRRLLLRLIEETGYFRSSFSGAGSEYTAFNEGVRSVGVRIVDEIEGAQPGKFAKMQSEAVALKQQQST